MEYSRQVTLKLANAENKTVYTAWVPEKFAKLNKLVYIDDTPDNQLWEVIEVYNLRKPTKELEWRSLDHERQRKASDI